MHAPTILIVEDFQPFREFICSSLQRAQFQVVGQAADGLEAVAKAEELQPDFILLDIGLPRLNGIEASKRIAEVAPHSRIVFVSRNNDPEVVKAALSDGAFGYVLKSETQHELIAALNFAVRNERFVSPKLVSLSVKLA